MLPDTLQTPVPAQPTGQRMLITAGQAFGYGSRVTVGLFFKLGVVLLSFYWTLADPRITRSWLLLVSPDRRESARSMLCASSTVSKE